MVQEVDHAMCGVLKVVGTPVKFSESRPGVRTAPPILGEHTDEILGGMLGMGEGEIRGLRESGTVS